MAPVLSRVLTTASIATLPSSSSLSPGGNRRLSGLRSAFLPQNGLRRGFPCSGLKWKLEKRNNWIAVRCDAAVAEKEATEGSGEKFEYQAEVGFSYPLLKFVLLPTYGWDRAEFILCFFWFI